MWRQQCRKAFKRGGSERDGQRDAGCPPSTNSSHSTSALDKHTFGGTVVIDPEQFASVTVLMGGTVNHLSVRPGQYVNKGEVIATLTNTEFIELQQGYMEAVAQTEYLESEYLRQQKLADNDAASKKKMQQSKADYLTMKSRKESTAVRLKMLGISGERLQKGGIVTAIPVTSPISGYVGDITANIGKYMDVGERICSVIDKNGVRLLFTVFSKDISEIHAGTGLRVNISSMPKESFDAVVTSIDPIMDPTSNSLKVYAKPTVHNSELKMGMYVRAVVK